MTIGPHVYQGPNLNLLIYFPTILKYFMFEMTNFGEGEGGGGKVPTGPYMVN